MKPAPLVTVLILVLTMTAVSGCFSAPHKITPTVGPDATIEPTAVPATATPKPTPAFIQPTMTVVDDTTSISGGMDGMANGFRLKQGAYVVTWSGSGTRLGFSLTDASGNGMANVSDGRTSGSRLMVIDDNSIYPGNYTLMATSDGEWSVIIKRPDTSSAVSLPVTVGAAEADGIAVSEPFKAQKGDLKISYSFSRTAYGTGYVNVYDVLTGESFYTRPMTGGSQTGMSNAEVPVQGVYIAQVTVPAGASYAEVTISQ
ncbi:MAG TPA: hypothetical protein VMC84_09805 [Methanocella sp.]|uniref:hypothetical protein n=1 Tax=Methanocella sp. TaxID=2052833 RepID=UPI002CFC56AD|nr:hypothetical protein [Methanocella sp.]HTY91459.1 hypothetical protein [Methanocella sp.]